MALARAKELDEYLQKNGKPIGPLHGLPISLKDQCRIKVSEANHHKRSLLTNQGLETSMGYVSWIGKYDKENSVLVDMLLKAGAVFYVKTSVPQSLMVCETVNNIIGRTVNPRNKNWSCGGSSGGEGAMVGFRGGIIGVGTDIGELSCNLQMISKTNSDFVQAVQFEYLLLSTFFTDFAPPTAVYHMGKWPTQWKDKRLSTLFAVH